MKSINIILLLLPVIYYYKINLVEMMLYRRTIFLVL
uniref:Uncharacterized protein n=1 Tax=Chondria sp. (in: red algae) TaxID=1982705 RepID=A0A1Z1MDW7_9FLOR|nr:hypothetical protein [Chondria sp. (in: red algae)]